MVEMRIPVTMYRVSEVARSKGVTPEVVRGWIEKRLLDAERLPGRHFRISPESLAAFDRKNAAAPSPK